MNKETIKKYRTEFNHYLNEGSLLWCRARDSVKKWEVAKDSHTDFFNTNDAYYIYIINDEYVEFRKALAEGKTVQYYRCIYTHEMCCNLDKYEWTDLQTSIFDKPVESYRIKPEEPRFKEGDIVVKKGVCAIKGPYKIVATVTRMIPRDEKSGTFNVWTTNGTYFDSELELWKPEPDEYCWFYKRGSNNPVFAKFVRNIDSNLGSYEAVGFVPNGPRASDEEQFGYFDRCEPFIGTLPTGLKDK